MALRVKICGITQLDQAQTIAQVGAHALGFICVPQSPRYLSPERIQSITRSLPEPIARVGVFMDADLLTLVQTVQASGLTSVQLHGTESPDYCQQVRSHLPEVELIKAFRIRRPEDLASTSAYDRQVDWLLLDAYHPHLGGGTGQTLDWQTLQEFQPNLPWFLAGGLSPDNVQAALTLVHPQGIDLSSGVERAPGDKDLQRVAQLFDQLR
jgi:phosphoribosylanthranilate isomerase